MIPGWTHLDFWDYYNKDLRKRLLLSDPPKMDGGKICPAYVDWFQALEMTKPDDVKVVIIGQDPYPTRGHAHGLAFSVLPHVKQLPQSLKRIFKEYQDDLDLPLPKNGCLRDWASRGVLLLNRVLTVEEGKASSHKGIGWERLSYEIVRYLSTSREKIVWLLWGSQAQELRGAIEGDHLILCSGHPSPLNNTIPFLGTKPFSKACEYLGESREFWRLT